MVSKPDVYAYLEIAEIQVFEIQFKLMDEDSSQWFLPVLQDFAVGLF